MRSSLFTGITFFLLLFVFEAPLQLIAQEEYNCNHTFKYGDRTGTFNYAVRVKCQNGTEIQLAAGPIQVRACGAVNTQVIVKFTTDGLDLKSNFRVIIRPECAQGTKHLTFVSGSSMELNEDSKMNGSFTYEIRGNGNGTLLIGYDVLKRKAGPGESCKYQLSIPYEITGFLKPEEEACEQALAAFRSNKLSGIQSMNEIIQKFPDAPCRTEVMAIMEDYLSTIRMLRMRKGAGNCPKVKDLGAQYNQKYPNGHFRQEVNEILQKCPDPPPVIKKEKTTKDPGPEEKDWLAIKNSKNPGDSTKILAFLEKYPNGKYAPEARKKLLSWSPIEVKEEYIDARIRRFVLSNTMRPKYKDMSLRFGLHVDDEKLSTENTFTATLENPGEYELDIRDSIGKTAHIKITSAAEATVGPLTDGSGFVVRVSGIQRPYSVLLVDKATNEKKLLSATTDGDTLLITRKELEKRNYMGQYSVIIQSKKRGTKPVEAAGILDNTSKAGTNITGILFLLALVLAAMVSAYLLYTYLKKNKAQQKKYINYDQSPIPEP